MSYIKSYNIGNISIDLPGQDLIYELPLLSFGDVKNTLNVSLIFNSNFATENTFYMSNGHKLNLHKRLVIRSEIPAFYENGDGRRIELMYQGEGRYTFDDDSQRIMRGTDNAFIVENPDYSTETYTTLGYFTSATDKYGETYLSYTYTSNKLTAVTYRTNKVISLSYNNLGTLNEIEYLCDGVSVCKIGLAYDGIAKSIVTHYSGVTYRTSYYAGVFTAQSTQGPTFADYCHRLTCTKGTDTITMKKEIGTQTVDLVTYNFADYANVGEDEYSQVEVTNFHGVKTRTQFKGRKPLYTYEIGEADAEFNDDKYAGTVQVYAAHNAINSVYTGGAQGISNGTTMDKVDANSEVSWRCDLSELDDPQGMYFLSGWVRIPEDDYTKSAIELHVAKSVNTLERSFKLPKPPIGQWSYFYMIFPYDKSHISAFIQKSDGSIETKDFRLSFEKSHTLSADDETKIPIAQDVLIYHNGTSEACFPISESVLSCGSTILSDNRNIYYDDLLRYKLNQRKGENTNEFYWGKGKNVELLSDGEDVIVTYDNTAYNLNDCYLEKRIYYSEKLTVSRVIDDDLDAFLIYKVTDGDNRLISMQKLDGNLDAFWVKSDNITTEYIRTNGLITEEKVAGLYLIRTDYEDDRVTVSNIDEEDNTIMSYAISHIDTVWGAVTNVEYSDGTQITDTYDDDRCALLSRQFNDNPSISNLFTYDLGYPDTLANGSLKYKMSYTDGRLSGISKLNATTTDTWNSIESHSYEKDETDGTVEIVSSYPSATSPLRTVTQNYDKYGRLTSISGTLTNTYDADPHCTYGNNVRYRGSTSDMYDIDGNEELEIKKYGSTPIINASAKLASSTDSSTGKTTHYGYYGDRLVAVKTTNSSSTVSKEVFTYDEYGRPLFDRFDYDLPGGKFVKSVIAYDDTLTSPNTNKRVKSYKYYVNSLSIHRVKTTNDFDNYGRISNKNIVIQSYGFNKYYTYNKTNIASVENKYLNSTRLMKNEYDYDSFGKIVGERYIDTAAKNKSYVYDSFGRLVRENNQILDKTYVYSYNGIGNITSVKAYDYTSGDVSGTPVTTSYAYDNAQPDRLTTFGGKAITYDANGCVKTYDGWTYTWTKGKLTKCVRGSILSGMDTYTYTYDAYGRRISKNYKFTKGSQALAVYVTSSSTNYTYDTSGRLIREQYTESFNDFSSNSKDILYLYDESGVIGFIYTLNGTPNNYYYLRNLQGDVIGIYDVFGVKVARYAYDAFGNCTITLNTNGIATASPIRYRGYYYDEDTKLYYLNARYYNPEWRRFVSPDETSYLDPESVNGLNLYAYCNNDPVNRYDPSGHAFISVLAGLGIAALIGAGISAASYTAGQLIDYAITGTWEWSWGGFFGSTIGGAIGGVITFATAGVGGTFATMAGAFLSGAAMTSGTMIGENIAGDAAHSFGDIFISSLISGGISMASVGIMSKINIPSLNIGRGSMSAVSKQMYTKFRRQIIKRISMRTFTKMFAVEAYNGAAGNIMDWVYGTSGAKDYVLNFF